MEKIISKLSGLGVVGLVLAVVLSTSGFAGAAALTSSLALLGGPFGMLGGIAFLGILLIVGTEISKYEIEKIAEGIIKKLIAEGKSKEEIIKEINEFPIISKDLKIKLIYYVTRI